MSLALLFHYLMLNMFRMLIHPSSGACDLFGVVSVYRLQPASRYHTTPAKPQRNTTHIEPEQYNPWNNSTNKSQAPEDGCINIRNILGIK